MTWEAFWWPQIAGALVGVLVTAVVGAPVGLLARKLWRDAWHQWLTAQRSVAADASLAAQDASATRQGQDDVARRLTAVEGTVEGAKEAISASLGHRAREELRFAAIEEALGLPPKGDTDAEAPHRAQGDRGRGRRAAARPADLGDRHAAQ